MDKQPTPTSLPDCIGKVILIVDENRGMQELLSLILEQEGLYQVSHVSRAAQALPVAHAIHPDLLIIAYELADRTGLQLYRQLQACQEQQNTPCIFLSAPLALPELQFYPFWNVQEPFRLDDLLKTTQQALSISALLEKGKQGGNKEGIET